jgi:hypothetical protein
MPGEFEGDLTDAEFLGVDMRAAHFRYASLTDVVITHSRLVGVDIDAFVDRVVINGVDVTDYVNERDRWFPLRATIQASDPEGLRGAWAALEAAWSPAIDRARDLTEAQRRESVGGEWSFVQTLRHLVFATDKWFTAPVLGAPFDPMGQPNSGSVDFDWPGLERDADPTFAAVLAGRVDRVERMRDYLARVTPADLTRTVEVLENGPAPVSECVLAVFEEEFEHLRYALRDLAHFD